MELPKNVISKKSLRSCLELRRSIRAYAPDYKLSPTQISELCFAAYGATDGTKRAAPSPCAVNAAVVHVALPEGIFRYDGEQHKLEKISDENRIAKFADMDVARGLWRCENIAGILIIGSNPDPIPQSRFKEQAHAERWAILESGCIAENVLLTCTSLDLGAVIAGAFHDEKVHNLAEFPDDCPTHVMVVIGGLKSE